MQKTPLVRMASKQKNLPPSIASIDHLPHKPQKELILRHIKAVPLLKFPVELIEGDVHSSLSHLRMSPPHNVVGYSRSDGMVWDSFITLQMCILTPA